MFARRNTITYHFVSASQAVYPLPILHLTVRVAKGHAFRVTFIYVRDIVVRRVGRRSSSHLVWDLCRLFRFPSASVKFVEVYEVEAIERVMVLQVVPPVVLNFIRFYFVRQNVVVQQRWIRINGSRFFRVIGAYLLT